MKILFFLLTATLSIASAADTITKWTDENGKVHYGDTSAVKFTEEPKTVEIRETFDQKSYNEARERHKETKEIGDNMEMERLAKEKKRREKETKSIKYTVVPNVNPLYGRDLGYGYPHGAPVHHSGGNTGSGGLVAW